MLRCQPPSGSWFDRRGGLSRRWVGAPPDKRLLAPCTPPPYIKTGKTVYYAEPQMNYGGVRNSARFGLLPLQRVRISARWPTPSSCPNSASSR